MVAPDAAVLSRRAFLQASASSTAGVALPTASLAADAPDPHAGAVGPAAVPLELEVNGLRRTLSVEPRTTLAEALRGPLGLTGTKIACDRGACSACTVWLDETPVCSCMTLAIEAAGRRVTTVEGLASGQALHPLQAAFIEHDALQCGYCTPGLLMSCAALLARQPKPGPDEVKAAIAGHLCRCGSLPHVVQATLAAARSNPA